LAQLLHRSEIGSWHVLVFIPTHRRVLIIRIHFHNVKEMDTVCVSNYPFGV
jgi:hypothetical protein